MCTSWHLLPTHMSSNRLGISILLILLLQILCLFNHQEVSQNQYFKLWSQDLYVFVNMHSFWQEMLLAPLLFDLYPFSSCVFFFPLATTPFQNLTIFLILLIHERIPLQYNLQFTLWSLLFSYMYLSLEHLDSIWNYFLKDLQE